jgi:hypothetical protein
MHADGSARLGPGTHEGHNNVAVKRFGTPKLAGFTPVGDEIRARVLERPNPPRFRGPAGAVAHRRSAGELKPWHRRRDGVPDRVAPEPGRPRWGAIVVLLAAATLTATGCASSAPSAAPTDAGPSEGSTGSPGPSPAVGAIDHPAGATDVILRLERGGGFVPMEFSATQAPIFSLYGNGIIVFQPKATALPPPGPGGIVKNPGWRTATLDEDQVQDLLQFALGAGGLGPARNSYPATGVADAPDTIFTVNAGGVVKRVTVNALGIDTRDTTDAAARTAFGALAARLEDIDRGGTIPTDVYVAERMRGILLAQTAPSGGVAVAWPWPSLTPSDFKAGSGDATSGASLQHRTMTRDEVGALGLTGIEGGAQGLLLSGPDDRTYTLILRPLLADEAS